MTCERPPELLQALFDEELDVVRALEMEAHLQTCPACAGRLRAERALRSVLRDPALVYPLPRSLGASVLSGLRREAPARRRVLGLAAAAAVVVAALLAYPRAAREDPRLAEVVSAHVRSQLADHLVDLPSSDQHAVKPWFNGKLDFTLPVTDLKDNGFPLVGGRLDYLGDRRVAALVYRRRQHIVNVFVWPGPGAPAAPRRHSRMGYEALEWSRGGLTYWAVSDLNSEDLESLASLLGEAPPEPH